LQSVVFESAPVRHLGHYLQPHVFESAPVRHLGNYLQPVVFESASVRHLGLRLHSSRSQASPSPPPCGILLSCLRPAWSGRARACLCIGARPFKAKLSLQCRLPLGLGRLRDGSSLMSCWHCILGGGHIVVKLLVHFVCMPFIFPHVVHRSLPWLSRAVMHSYVANTFIITCKRTQYYYRGEPGVSLVMRQLPVPFILPFSW
jgi:hypothetical protein